MAPLPRNRNRPANTARHGGPFGHLTGTTAYPVADIYETDDELIVKAELPGVDPKMVDVRLENNVLSIRGERRFERNVDKENYHRMERLYGSFCRSFSLPTSVESDKIRADCKD